MGKEFTQEMAVGYFGIDHDLFLSPAGLANYFQDIAIMHSDFLGYTIPFLSARHKGWAIINWHMQINQYPKFSDTIKITTWSNECRKMQAQRSFLVAGKDNKPLINAVSRWIFMDLERRRPSSFLEGMEEAYLCDRPSAILNETYAMPKIEEENLVSTRRFSVTRRDTDTNGHANNIKYMEWAADDVSDEIYDNYKIRDIRVVYRKECKKGDMVLSKCYVKKRTDSKIEVISLFSDDKNEKTVFAEIAAVWEKKEAFAK